MVVAGSVREKIGYGSTNAVSAGLSNAWKEVKKRN